jgi:hypothetical protein
MAYHEWIEKEGHRILYLNIASRNLAELEERVNEFREVIDGQPEGSLLTITDVTGGHFDQSMKNALDNYIIANKPYIKQTVIVGLSGLQKVIYQGILRVTCRTNLIVKDTFDEAVEFLVSLDDVGLPGR